MPSTTPIVQTQTVYKWEDFGVLGDILMNERLHPIHHHGNLRRSIRLVQSRYDDHRTAHGLLGLHKHNVRFSQLHCGK